MDSILFILMLFCLVYVAAWYMGNDIRGADGEWGLLGVAGKKDDSADDDAPKYNEKEPHTALGKRIFKAQQAATRGAPESGSSSYKLKTTSGRFREKGSGAYVSRGDLPRYGERPAGRSPDKSPSGKPSKD
ncbi:MAG TPA: hypothetical protein PLV61_08855 [Parvularculaceae bacterium]|nr:hypothetical protein [Amphiplicatus sp.]MCB9955237.1 hypothetical protein [Caulobacterales bacterium]HPE31290.1 hypothetical protein [Parvularculaceae bacterium]